MIKTNKIATTLNRAYLATARSPSPKFPFGTSDTLQPLSETFLFCFEINLDLSLNRTPEHNLFVVAWVMIDRSVLGVDLMFVSLEEICESEPFPGFRVRSVNTRFMTLAYWEVGAGSVLPLHRHPHEQVMNVVEGVFELTVEDVTQRLESGVVAIIPPDAPHSGRAITDCSIIDVFYPIREDFIR